MEVQYRRSFLRDLKKLKGQPVYGKVFELAFTTLPEADRLRDVTGAKAMRETIQIAIVFVSVTIPLG